MSILDNIMGLIWGKPTGSHTLTIAPFPGNTWYQVAPATTPGAYNYVYSSAGLYDHMQGGEGLLVRQPLRVVQGAGMIDGVSSWEAPKGGIAGQIIKQPLYG